MSELKYDAIIIGNTYGRLTAVKRGEDYVSPNGCRFQRHVYKCKCGNEKTIRDIDVQNGRTKSCGCLHKEKSAEVMRKIGKSNKKLNAHMLSENGTYTIIVTSNGDEVDIDTEDYEKVKNFCWCLQKNKKKSREKWYVYARNTVEGAKEINKDTILLHDVIMDAYNESIKQSELVVDHIDGNPLNNRKSNLRFATQQENQWNKNKTRANTSGYKGVCWDKRKEKWEAYAYADRKKISAGFYENIKDAAKASIELRKRIQGRFFRE